MEKKFKVIIVEDVKLELKGNVISVTSSIAINYETFSYLAYLPPTATLVIYMRVMRGTL